MANAVFVHKPDSPYDDSESQYHFPKVYLKRVEQTVGDRIVYYGTCEGRPGRYYNAVAKVNKIRPDSARSDHFYAEMAEHIEFDAPVDYLSNGGFESKLVMPDGKVNGGTAQSAVRIIAWSEFTKIINAGFGEELEFPNRDRAAPEVLPPNIPASGFEEETELFIERDIVSQLTDRKFRDRRFRHHVLNAYDRRCAFTGLRIINGGGRPEVEAAHIVPVEQNGSDSIRNGIALSGTVHWMFDAGLLALSDDFAILKSRHINYDFDHLLNSSGKAILPSNPELWPGKNNLKWHRENKFKT